MAYLEQSSDVERLRYDLPYLDMEGRRERSGETLILSVPLFIGFAKMPYKDKVGSPKRTSRYLELGTDNPNWLYVPLRFGVHLYSFVFLNGDDHLRSSCNVFAFRFLSIEMGLQTIFALPVASLLDGINTSYISIRPPTSAVYRGPDPQRAQCPYPPSKHL